MNSSDLQSLKSRIDLVAVFRSLGSEAKPQGIQGLLFVPRRQDAVGVDFAGEAGVELLFLPAFGRCVFSVAAVQGAELS